MGDFDKFLNDMSGTPKESKRITALALAVQSYYGNMPVEKFIERADKFLKYIEDGN